MMSVVQKYSKKKSTLSLHIYTVYTDIYSGFYCSIFVGVGSHL